MIAAFSAFIGAASWWAVGQTTIGSRLLDPSIQEELTALAIENPEQFAAEIERYRTPEDRVREQIAHLGITNSAAYFRLFPKSQEQLAVEAAALETMAHPITVAERLQQMAPDERRAAENALYEILNPPGLTH